MCILGLFRSFIPELSNNLWQRTTVVTVGFFAGHKCKNNNRWYSDRLNRSATFYSMYVPNSYGSGRPDTTWQAAGCTPILSINPTAYLQHLYYILCYNVDNNNLDIFIQSLAGNGNVLGSKWKSATAGITYELSYNFRLLHTPKIWGVVSGSLS